MSIYLCECVSGMYVCLCRYVCVGICVCSVMHHVYGCISAHTEVCVNDVCLWNACVCAHRDTCIYACISVCVCVREYIYAC